MDTGEISGESQGNVQGNGVIIGGTKNVELKLADNFEILGDWITVSKKKKKSTPRDQGQKGNGQRPVSNGPMIEKSVPRKEWEEIKRGKNCKCETHYNWAQFTFGSPSRVEPSVQGNRNKRSRFEETNRQGGDHFVANQSLDPGDRPLQVEGQQETNLDTGRDACSQHTGTFMANPGQGEITHNLPSQS